MNKNSQRCPIATSCENGLNQHPEAWRCKVTAHSQSMLRIPCIQTLNSPFPPLPDTTTPPLRHKTVCLSAWQLENTGGRRLRADVNREEVSGQPEQPITCVRACVHWTDLWRKRWNIRGAFLRARSRSQGGRAQGVKNVEAKKNKTKHKIHCEKERLTISSLWH